MKDQNYFSISEEWQNTIYCREKCAKYFLTKIKVVMNVQLFTYFSQMTKWVENEKVYEILLRFFVDGPYKFLSIASHHHRHNFSIQTALGKTILNWSFTIITKVTPSEFLDVWPLGPFEAKWSVILGIFCQVDDRKKWLKTIIKSDKSDGKKWDFFLAVLKVF